MGISGRRIMAIPYHSSCFVLVGKEEIALAIESTGHNNQESALVNNPRLPALQSGIDRIYELQQRPFHC